MLTQGASSTCGPDPSGRLGKEYQNARRRLLRAAIRQGSPTHDFRRPDLRGSRRLRRGNLRDRRRAGRDRDGAGAERRRAAGAAAGIRRPGGGGRRPRRCPRRRTIPAPPSIRRKSRWRAGSAAPRTSGAAACCRSTHSTSAPGSGSASRPGRSPGATSRRRRRRPARCSAPAPRSGASRCPGSPPTMPSASSSLERWSNVPRIQILHRDALAARENLLVALGATATGFVRDAGRVTAVALHLERRGHGRVTSPPSSSRPAATRARGCSSPSSGATRGSSAARTGHWVLLHGHVNGQIAEIEIAGAALDAGLDFHQDGQGSYVRRRLVPSETTQERDRLTNVAFWPVVPPIADPAHRSGPLSAVFLALSAAPLGRRLIAEPIRLKHVGEPPYRRGRISRTSCATPDGRSASRRGSSGRPSGRSRGCRGCSSGTRRGATASNTTPSTCHTRRAG